MNAMQLLLSELDAIPGVRGSAVATGDGMVVASALQGRFREDVVSGLTSFLVLTTQRALGTSTIDIERFVLHSTHGKLVILDIGQLAYLIVITDQFARMETLLTMVEDVAVRLRRLATLEVSD